MTCKDDLHFECDQCGACCKTFPIYASTTDAEREPKIVERTLELKEWLQTREWRYTLHPLPFQKSCCFLGTDNLCSIYQSRPNVCKSFAPGSTQCEEARKRVGLAALKTSNLSNPSI